MLRWVDSGLELVGWSLAVFFVVLLFAGPRVVAEDKPQTKAAGAAPASAPAAPAAPTDGKVVFTDNCGSCHTLSAAGTSGSVGPNLDGVSLDAAGIEAKVRSGSGGMPAFGGKLSDAQIAAVAKFVSGN